MINRNTIGRIEKNNIRWLGHVLRMEEEIWPNQLFKWISKSKKKRGQSKTSWKTNIMIADRKRENI